MKGTTPLDKYLSAREESSTAPMANDDSSSNDKIGETTEDENVR